MNCILNLLYFELNYLNNILILYIFFQKFFPLRNASCYIYYYHYINYLVVPILQYYE